MSINSYDEYFIKLAELISQKSKDPSAQVGCVIVGPDNEIRSTGFNGFPRGVHEKDYSHYNGFNAMPAFSEIKASLRWERPAKYEWVEHAERNAVYNAARTGVALKGCRAYLNWVPTPCIDCTRAFIQVGIVEVIGPDRPFTTNNDWKFATGVTMMAETGLEQRWVECNL